MSLDPGVPPLTPSRAEIVLAAKPCVNSALSVEASILEKLRQSISEVFKVDEVIKQRAKQRFQHALCAKLFGKAPAFELVKSSLLG